MDRTAFSVTTFEEADAEDRAFWHAQTPGARLRALEYLRRTHYGDAATAPIQRFFEFVERDGS
ncbi:MAG: hypothetical protein Rubg2KO_38310 [Rubricoccaceae bacterium]